MMYMVHVHNTCYLYRVLELYGMSLCKLSPAFLKGCNPYMYLSLIQYTVLCEHMHTVKVHVHVHVAN